MTNIRESRYLTINSKIIKLKDVQKLASILWQEHQFDEENDLHNRFDITVRCEGNSAFDSENISILDEGVLPSSKRVRSITLSYRGFGRDAYIEIDLSHGDIKNYNGASVKGSDSIWVNGTLSKIVQIIEGYQPQNNFFTKYNNWFFVVLSIGFGFLITRLLYFLPIESSSTDNPAWFAFILASPILLYMVRTISYIFIGSLPAAWVMSKMGDLWPSIEIQIGPDHTFTEKRRRLWFTNLVVLGLIPLLVSFVYDLIIPLLNIGGG